MKACIEARAAVAELKQAAGLIPSQGVLINTLPLLETRAGSEIGNIVTTAVRLFGFRENGERFLHERVEPDPPHMRRIFLAAKTMNNNPLVAEIRAFVASLPKT